MVRPRSELRLAGVVLVLAAALLALARAASPKPSASACAGRLIVGTNGNDVLRGGPCNDILEGLGGNDRLYGGPGNDRLYGGPGNDLLVGGPGNDRIVTGPGRDRVVCGAGYDIVYANPEAKVSRDCEVVHRWKTSSPGVSIESGSYSGDGVSFDFSTPAHAISNVKIDFTGSCGGSNTHIEFDDSGPFAVQPGGTFAVDGQESGTTLKLNGALAPGGVATGTYDLQLMVAGVNCDTGNIDWRAQKH